MNVVNNDSQATDNCPEPEALAALADGSVGATERDALMGHLADCELCYRIFTDLVRLQEEEPASVRPQRARRSQRWLMPAALAASAILAFALWRPWADSLVNDAPELPALTASTIAQGGPAAALGPEWTQPPWHDSQRGPEGPGSLGRARDLRLGAQTVTLDIAIATGDPRQETVLRGLTAELKGLPDNQVILASYLALENSWDLAAARTAAKLLADHPEISPAFGLGQWLAAGRFAAASGAGEYFAAPTFRSFLEELEAPEVSAATRQELEGLLADENLAAVEKVLLSVLGGEP